MKKIKHYAFTGAALLLFSCRSHQKAATALSYPVTKTVDSADTFFGTTVADPYRWLEYDTASGTKTWIQDENKVTDNYLSQIPFRDTIKKELTGLISYTRLTSPYKEGDYYYFSKNTGLQNQSVIYRTKNPADTATAEVFIDPNSFAHNGSVTMQETSFSNDGTLFAYLISNGGSDWRDVLVKDTKRRKPGWRYY